MGHEYHARFASWDRHVAVAILRSDPWLSAETDEVDGGARQLTFRSPENTHGMPDLLVVAEPWGVYLLCTSQAARSPVAQRIVSALSARFGAAQLEEL